MTTLARLSPGQVFARDFRVTRLLSEGGMGAVYAVEQLSTARPRALKVMHPTLVEDPRHRARFAQEARIPAQIDSAYVVEVVGAGIDDGTGLPWLAMELLDGGTLAAWLQARGPQPPAVASQLLGQLGQALAQAHARGIVHRDLKPENVFVCAPKVPGVPFTIKVLDFGISVLMQENRNAATLTTAGGTSYWMAPEQANVGDRIGPPADVWAFGLLAFFVLTNKPYWRAANSAAFNLSALLVEVMMQPLEPASARCAQLGATVQLPPAFDGWFARCVVRAQEQRYQNLSEALGALLPVLEGAPAVITSPHGSGIPSGYAPTMAVGVSAVSIPPMLGPPTAPPAVPPGPFGPQASAGSTMAIPEMALGAGGFNPLRGPTGGHGPPQPPWQAPFPPQPMPPSAPWQRPPQPPPPARSGLTTVLLLVGGGAMLFVAVVAVGVAALRWNRPSRRDAGVTITYTPPQDTGVGVAYVPPPAYVADVPALPPVPVPPVPTAPPPGIPPGQDPPAVAVQHACSGSWAGRVRSGGDSFGARLTMLSTMTASQCGTYTESYENGPCRWRLTACRIGDGTVRATARLSSGECNSNLSFRATCTPGGATIRVGVTAGTLSPAGG
ncbi:MAG: serine/threonine protein kinase [Deltaproteobacteria bacterium]|nr:serine/threonine protein kinase [Deltaproteobacteria bacterium]